MTETEALTALDKLIDFFKEFLNLLAQAAIELDSAEDSHD